MGNTRIVYMDTPEFAVPALAALHESGGGNNWQVVGVVTQPERPAGRGKRLEMSPVKEYALAHDLPVLQPGRLLDALDTSGLAEETAVFVFSDHGDWAGDYGLVEKWTSAAEDLITRVPLIVRIPGGTAGHTVAEPVELFDVIATTLELAGVPAQHTHFARSLTPQLRGAAGDPDRAVFCEGGYAPHEPHCFEGQPHRDQFARTPDHIYFPKGQLQQTHPNSVCRNVMVRTATHKLVYRPTGVSELYDLVADPLELHNIHGAAAYRDVQASLERRLLDWYVQTADVTPYNEDPRGHTVWGVQSER